MPKFIAADGVELIKIDDETYEFRCKSTPVPTPPTPTPTPPLNVMGTIDVQNFTSTDTDATIIGWCKAVKIQTDRDVAPIWGSTVNFNFISKGTLPFAGHAQCGFFDNSDTPGALGWHDLGPNGEALIKCFTKESESFGSSPSITLSHETIECIGDWNANTQVKGVDEAGRPCMYFQELCDAVESNTYQINGIDVSDFVTPNWFSTTPKTNEMDFLKVLAKQFTIASGGYMEISYDNGQTWTQVNKASKRAAFHQSPHSRWALYKKRPEDRIKSTFKMQP